MKYYVYAMVNSIDNKVFYIGKGTANRFSSHMSHARKGNRQHVYCKIRKIQDLGGTIIFNKLHEYEDEKEAFAKEIELIASYGRENLTNKTNGGDGASGYKPTEETRKKLSVAGMGKEPWNKGKKNPQWINDKISKRQKEIGRKMSEYNKEQIRKAIKGVPKSEECKRKLSISRTGKNLSQQTIDKMLLARIGYKHSEETKRKIGEGNKGKILSEDTRRKISIAHTGKHLKEEQKLKYAKRVMCIDTGKIYPSLSYAAKDLGVKYRSISQAIKWNYYCKGKKYKFI